MLLTLKPGFFRIKTNTKDVSSSILCTNNKGFIILHYEAINTLTPIYLDTKLILVAKGIAVTGRGIHKRIKVLSESTKTQNTSLIRLRHLCFSPYKGHLVDL